MKHPGANNRKTLHYLELKEWEERKVLLTPGEVFGLSKSSHQTEAITLGPVINRTTARQER